MSGKGIFITGTDTGVGKTYVGALIAAVLRERGVDVGVMKPVETGCRTRASRLWPEDAAILSSAAESGDALDDICPYRFREPLAPAVAAERSRRRIQMRRLVKSYRDLSRRHSLMIVEGAGGIMVPLTFRSTYLDLAASLQLPVIVVARPNLGTINHSLLTVAALRSRRIPILGIVLNDARGMLWGAAERTCPPVIQAMANVPVLDVVRFGSRNLPGTLRKISDLSPVGIVR